MVQGSNPVAADSDDMARVVTYASLFLKAYTETIDRHSPEVLRELDYLGLTRDHLPHHRLQLGDGVGIVVATAEHDFYLFFVRSTRRSAPRHVRLPDKFDEDWTNAVPYERRWDSVRELLELEQPEIGEPVNLPMTNFFAFNDIYLRSAAHGNGVSRAQRDAIRARERLPHLREENALRNRRQDLARRYQELGGLPESMSEQVRGNQFEELWRDLLALHGWKPKKIRISGEDNDFTAIYNGLHILGEVRWFKKQMTGGKMREFLAKLDARPQTIGMFVSHSGFNKGALSVRRRSIATKTIVCFDRADIDSMLLRHGDLAGVFNEKLRDAYDSLFEEAT